MKRYLAIHIALHFALSTNAQHDGPYVFYKESAVVKSIRDGAAIETKLPKDKVVQVPLSATQFLSVRLKDSLSVPASVYPEQKKLFVFSDIEGELDGFLSILKGNSVIDENNKWIYRDGHIVICGDLFDRGKDVTTVLWFLYYLEDEALKNGGMVHVVLGNHDLMNLNGDFRYVQFKYFQHAEKFGMHYRDLYAANTELGRWLRTKNVMEKIGDHVFLHAGISKEVVEQKTSIEEINRLSRPWFDKPTIEMPDNVDKFIGANSYSLTWYRGHFSATKEEELQIDEALRFFSAKRIFIGHTVMSEITSLYSYGKVIAVDVNHHTGNHQAVLIENGKLYRVDVNGKRTNL